VYLLGFLRVIHALGELDGIDAENVLVDVECLKIDFQRLDTVGDTVLELLTQLPKPGVLLREDLLAETVAVVFRVLLGDLGHLELLFYLEELLGAVAVLDELVDDLAL